MKKIIVLITSMFIIFTSNIIYANNEKDISIEPIFTKEDGVWYPGKIDSKDFCITNNNEKNISINRLNLKLQSSKYLKLNQIIDISSAKFKELSKNTIVKLKYKDTIIFEEKLNNLLSKKEFVLKEDIYLKSKEKVLLNLTIDMDRNMNNDAQSLENIFNVGVVYKINEDELIKPDMPNNKKPPIESDNFMNSDNNLARSISGNLPKTGGIINSSSLTVVGILTIGTGIILNKKSSKKGGKSHE